MSNAAASKYWEHLNATGEKALEEHGYEFFKRGFGLIYNDLHIDDLMKGSYQGCGERITRVWEDMYRKYPAETLDKFHEPAEGSPVSVEFKGRQVSTDLAFSLVEYFILKEHVDFSKIETIAETGCGYGRLPYVICQLHPHITYRLYDLEPSIQLAKRYLTSVLPEAKVEFYTAFEDGWKKDCDLFIAINCLHEMTEPQIEEYFEFANNHTNFFFYTCWKYNENKWNGLTLTKDSYPARDNWKELFCRNHSFMTKFFEAMYKI